VEGYARRRVGRRSGEHDYIKAYSTGQVIDLLGAVADELAARRLKLSCRVIPLDSPEPASAELAN
jgi:hypothetical protein